MKRFYDAVGVTENERGWQVTLDGRGIKTVKGKEQALPTRQLAQMLAAEWDVQGEELDPSRFPFRDMADYALDVISPDTQAATEKLVTYGDTDTLLYRADPDEALYTRQQEVWEPIVAAFEKTENIALTRISGIIHRPQSEDTLARLRSRLSTHNHFALAGLEAMTSLAASLLVGLSALKAEQEADAVTLWHAASLEEEWQADLWGRDLEAEDRRAKRQTDFLNAWRFVRASQA